MLVLLNSNYESEPLEIDGIVHESSFRLSCAGLTYAAIEVGGVDPIMVMSKAEMWLGWEHGAISGKVDPTLGQLGLVIVLNECLEPLRLPVVVMTTRPVVNAFQSK